MAWTTPVPLTTNEGISVRKLDQEFVDNVTALYVRLRHQMVAGSGSSDTWTVSNAADNWESDSSASGQLAVTLDYASTVLVFAFVRWQENTTLHDTVVKWRIYNDTDGVAGTATGWQGASNDACTEFGFVVGRFTSVAAGASKTFRLQGSRVDATRSVVVTRRYLFLVSLSSA